MTLHIALLRNIPILLYNNKLFKHYITTVHTPSYLSINWANHLTLARLETTH